MKNRLRNYIVVVISLLAATSGYLLFSPQNIFARPDSQRANLEITILPDDPRASIEITRRGVIDCDGCEQPNTYSDPDREDGKFIFENIDIEGWCETGGSSGIFEEDYAIFDIVVTTSTGQIINGESVNLSDDCGETAEITIDVELANYYPDLILKLSYLDPEDDFKEKPLPAIADVKLEGRENRDQATTPTPPPNSKTQKFIFSNVEPGRYKYSVNWLSDIRCVGANSDRVPFNITDVPVTVGNRDKIVTKIIPPGETAANQCENIIDVGDDLFPDDPGDSEDPTENADNCKGGTGYIDGFLGFIVCPFVESILGMIHWAETNVIIPYLIINPISTEDDNTVYIMWQALRNIAFVLLVVAFMYLVFAETTALGGEAYQLKRLAPRLVMVTIAISLSYLAIGLVIDFFNVLGLGIAQITAWAMKETNQTTLVTVEGGAAAAGLMAFLTGTGALALTSALIGGSLAAPIIGIAAVTGIFIVLAVVITLILRQVVVMGLVILSPLAFVSLLLPNTEKLFKSWWSIITKALVMYPLVMLLFAAGKIFGAIINTMPGSGAADDAIKSLLGFLANIAPMALIPFTFKISGGAIGGAWGAMRGGIGKGRKAALGSEHNPRSVLYKGREKSYKNMSERMAGERSWLPQLPGSRNNRTPYNQKITAALGRAPLIGGWMAGNERIAGARADAEKRMKEMAATPIGMERLREEGYGSEAMDAVHPNHHDHDSKPVPGYRSEAARNRANHQRQVMVAKTLGASKEDGGSDERTRHFAQNIKKRVDRKEISAKQGDELWEEFSRAAAPHNALLLASTQGAGGVRASREAFATDTSLFGATTVGVGAGGAAVSIAGTGRSAIAEQLLGDENVAKDLITRTAGRQGNPEQQSVQSTKALETLFTPDAAGNLSPVAQRMLASASSRGNLEQVVLKFEGRNRSSTAAIANDPEAAGYNVTGEQSVAGQAAAAVIRQAIYTVNPNFEPGVTGAPVVPPTTI